MEESITGSLLNESEIYTKLFSNSSTNKKFNDNDLWNNIVDEYESKRKECEEFVKSKSKIPPLPDEIVQKTTWGYMDENVFPILIPALNSMMFKAKKYHAVRYNKKTRFNGLDHLAELLWNFNPKYPDRYKNYTDIYDIPFVIEHLKKNPRTIFPKSEIWTQNYAALKIQSFYRGYLVRRQEDVQEMRKFWKEYPKETILLLDHVEVENNRDSVGSRRFQCFCDTNATDCINPTECELVEVGSIQSPNIFDNDLFTHPSYF